MKTEELIARVREWVGEDVGYPLGMVAGVLEMCSRLESHREALRAITAIHEIHPAVRVLADTELDK